MNYFYLFASCIPVKGYNRSIIIDTQRKTFFFIPNDLYHILLDCREKTIEHIKQNFEQQDIEIIDEYFNFLINEKLGLYVESLDNFIPVNLTYESPNQITNAIVEVSKQSLHDYVNIFFQLNKLNTEALELQFHDSIKMDSFIDILNQIKNSSFRSITIIIPYKKNLECAILEILHKYPRIKTIVFYKSAFNKTVYNENVKILYLKQKSISAENCGNISPKYFSFSLITLCESLSYNICLNRKVCITTTGEIKNCPGCWDSFGNIKKDSLDIIIQKDEFRKMWKIKKDDIKVCKDCEMRYICHDCRVHISDTEDLLSKPSKCSYNPYNNTW